MYTEYIQLLLPCPTTATACLPVDAAACQGKVVSSDSVFYWALAPLAVFYALFAAVLLPNAAAIHPTALAEQYVKVLPAR